MKKIYLLSLIAVFVIGLFCNNAFCSTDQHIINIKVSDNAKLIVVPEKGKHKLKVVFSNYSNDTIAFQSVGYVLSEDKGYTLYRDVKITIQQDNKTLSSDEVRFKNTFLRITIPTLRVIPPQTEYTISLGYRGNLVEDFELLKDKPFFIYAEMSFSQREDLTSQSLWYLKNHPKTFLRTDTICTSTTKYLNTSINLFGMQIELDGFPKAPILFYRQMLKSEKYCDITILMICFIAFVFGVYFVCSQKKILWKSVGTILSVLIALLIMDILLFIFYGY